MKPIIAQDQARLGVARCVRLAVSGMSYRLLRSGITTAILALAVAFLVHVLTHGILAERVQRSAYEALGPTRQAAAQFTRFSVADSAADVRDAVAKQDPDRLAEYRAWWKPTPEDLDEGALVQSAGLARRIEQWAEQLDASESAVLLGGQGFPAWMQRIEFDDDGWASFGSKLEALRLGWPLGDRESFQDFVRGRWPGLMAATQGIRAGHEKAIDALTASDPRPILERFADADADLSNALAQAGFVISPHRRADLQDTARYLSDLGTMQRVVDDPRYAPRVRELVGSAELDDLLQHILAEGAWRESPLADAGITAAAQEGLARRYLSEQRFAEVTDNYEPVTHRTPFGLPPGTLWLVGLSLLVCVVGVTNALLMSVTERFNEIATMKCLGAMDRSIMQMFVAEAVIQGVLGGTVGVLLGLLLTLLRGFAEFGTLLGRGMEDWASLLGAAGLSLGVGVLLAASAAIGPSWIASRLAPMEAMRVE